MKIVKILSLVTTEAVTEKKSLLHAAGNIVAVMVGYETRRS